VRHDPTSPLLTTTPRYPSTASALRELGSSVHAPPPPVAATVKLLLLCGNSASALAFLDAYSTVPFEAKDTAVLRAAVLLELGRVEEAHRLCPRLCQEKLWHQGEFWRLLSVSVGGDYTEGSGDRIPGSIVRFFVERVRDAAEAGSKKDVAVSLLVSYFLQKGRVREAAAVHLDALGAPRSSEGRRAFKKRESLVRGALEIHGHRGEAALGTAAAGGAFVGSARARAHVSSSTTVRCTIRRLQRARDALVDSSAHRVCPRAGSAVRRHRTDCLAPPF
jgi:hypothetical protein